MPIGIYEKNDIDAVAKTIRNNLDDDTKYTVKQMPDAINKIQIYAYNSGHSEGKAEGLEEGKAIGYEEGKTDGIAEGIEQGKKSQYDEFWDNYQNFGNRTDYNYAFTGRGFNFANFYPKYDIKPVGYMTYIFYAWETSKHYGSLTQRLKECGVVLDTSGISNMTSMFAYSSFTEFPTINCTGLSTSSASTHVFANCYSRVNKIEKIIVKEGVAFTNWFLNSNFEEVIFEGVISTDSLNLQWSTRLTHESLMSVINCLKDNSGTSTWNTITLGAENIAKLTPEELEIMDAKQWNYN